MSKVHRTTEELVQLYTALTVENRNRHEVAKELGIPYVSLTKALVNLNKYLKGKHRDQNRHSKVYREAVKLIRKQNRIVQRSEPTPEPTDNLATLKQSVDTFQQAVLTFIEADTKRRYKVLKEENAVLRQENEKLKAEVEGLRSNNWLAVLEEKLPEEGE